MTMRDIDKRDALRPLVERLARLLASADGARVAALMQDIELFWGAMRPQAATPAAPAAGAQTSATEPATEPVSATEPAPAPARSVGIWTEEADGTWSRQPYSEAWHRYADIDVIPAKRPGRRRVLLLGESVARGYLYDPVMTLAGATERYLGQLVDDVEIVDLANTGSDTANLTRMLRHCDGLQPDAIIVFAGNNWMYEAMPALAQREFLNVWIDEGAAAAQRHFLDEVLSARVDDTLDACVAAAARNQVPLVFVLPETNLIDFVDYAHSLVPALPADGPARWLAEYVAAEEALSAQQLARCEQHAQAMLQLDAGLHPTAHGLLARCALADGDTERALAHLARARDSQCGLPTEFTPRCPSLVHEQIRARAAGDGFALIDLPRLFSSQGQLPNQDLFLDYCHLSLDGLKQVASELARALARALGDGDGDGGAIDIDIDFGAVSVAPIHAACAHFLAAVHCSNVGSSWQLVRDQLDRALRVCPDVHHHMRRFLDFRSRPKPDWMCASFDDACESPIIHRYLSSRSLAWQLTIGDVPLFRAIEAALAAHGVPAGQPIEEARRAQARALTSPINVLELHRAPVLHMTLRRTSFLQCHQREMRFYLPLAEPTALRLLVTWRSVGAGPEARATLRLGGVEIAARPISSTWSSFDVTVEPERVVAGINEIVVEWPVNAGQPSQPERAELDGARAAPPRLFHVFGDLARLSAEV